MFLIKEAALHPLAKRRPPSAAMAALAVITVAGAVALPSPATGTVIPTCTTHDFKITEIPSQGAGGSFLLDLSYRNITHSSCQTHGFPGVTLIGRGQRRLGVGQRLGDKVPRLVVKPHARVYGRIQYSETSHPPRRCRAVTAVRLFAPNSTESSTVRLPHGSQFCSPPILVYPLAHSTQGPVQ
ncbi:MAG TPA: DUF4232 domain-containing protein [Solirubrobacteraceae bacterium]|nr:DUF4232 domain-containing protein [Solirubrobacteraceae bacterium]